MKFTISNRLRLGILSLGSLGLVNLALIDTSLRTLGLGTNLIERTGSLRTRFVRTFQWHLLDNPQRGRSERAEIKELLGKLRNGDSNLGLPKATDPRYLAKLDALDAALVDLEKLLASTKRDPRMNDRLVESIDSFFKLADETTQVAKTIEQEVVARSRITIVLYSIISLAAVLLIWFFVEQVVKTLGKSTKTMTATSTQIANTVTEQERYLSEQAASVSETTSAIEELGASSRQAAEQASASATGAQQALSLSSNGAQIVAQTMDGIGELQQKVEAIAGKIMQLSEQTAQISGISDLVADIANQTNMLSLNAAVEAARAGEQGKGFAVVAGEVRKLAEQSKKSAEKINTLVTEVNSPDNFQLKCKRFLGRKKAILPAKVQ